MKYSRKRYYKLGGKMSYKELIQTQYLTPKFCVEVILNDFIPKTEDDMNISELYILKYQTHITEEELERCWVEYNNNLYRDATMAKYLNREEKIVLLEYHYKPILDKMNFETKQTTLRAMIRRMRIHDWFLLLQEKIV